MARTTNVFVRVEPERKEQAESAKESLNAELLKGVEDTENGWIISVDNVEKEIKGMYNS